MNALSMPAKRLTAHFALSWCSLGTLLALLPVSFQAERRERVEILRGMIAHKIDCPRADEKKRRREGNDSGTDHDGAPIILARIFPVLPEHFCSGDD
jgi:hypothetical protein